MFKKVLCDGIQGTFFIAIDLTKIVNRVVRYNIFINYLIIIIMNNNIKKKTPVSSEWKFFAGQIG